MSSNIELGYTGKQEAARDARIDHGTADYDRDCSQSLELADRSLRLLFSRQTESERLQKSLDGDKNAQYLGYLNILSPTH